LQNNEDLSSYSALKSDCYVNNESSPWNSLFLVLSQQQQNIQIGNLEFRNNLAAKLYYLFIFSLGFL
jgi:hypothetical protein